MTVCMSRPTVEAKEEVCFIAEQLQTGSSGRQIAWTLAWSSALECLTGCLHGTIVGPTGRSDPGYVRLSVRPVGQTGRTDCSRTAHIRQSHQCGLLADYNTAYAAAWLVIRLASRSDQSDVVSTRFDSRIGSRTKSNMFDSSDRLSDRSYEAFTRYDRRTDQSDRPVGPTGRSDDRNV